MASKTNIVNQALRLLGANEVNDLDDDTEEAKVASTFYDTSKETVLSEKFNWVFALNRAAIAADATPPDWGYANRYLLPADFLIVDYIDEVGVDEEWEIEGQYLLIDRDGPLNLRYIANVDESRMTSLYVSCLAAQLAGCMAGALPESRGKMQDMVALYDRLMRNAGVANARQSRASQVRSGQVLFTARRSQAVGP